MAVGSSHLQASKRLMGSIYILLNIQMDKTANDSLISSFAPRETGCMQVFGWSVLRSVITGEFKLSRFPQTVAWLFHAFTILDSDLFRSRILWGWIVDAIVEMCYDFEIIKFILSWESRGLWATLDFKHLPKDAINLRYFAAKFVSDWRIQKRFE